jgi:hypothetical protein
MPRSKPMGITNSEEVPGMDRAPIATMTARARRLLVGGEGLPPSDALAHLLREAALRLHRTLGVEPVPDLLPRPAATLRPDARDALAGLLDAPALQPAWAAPETLGWLYQYFMAAEKDEVWRRLYQQRRQKIARQDLPVVTQLFTPGWIVAWLVQNTLGRHWLQMHPDSRLASAWPCLVPLHGDIPRVAVKPVRALTVLDPACGTMHFGLAAFDLLAAMYREELERAGEPGWPASPSVADAGAIPAAIVTCNLFGMDIDPAALQLAELSLCLKAGARSPNLRFTGGHPAGSLHRTTDAARYDVIITNPPYLYYSSMEEGLAAYLAEQYPTGKWDLYAAFIQRCVELLAPGGRLGMITQQSFLFIGSYAGLRQRLLAETAVEAAAQLGTRAFEEIVGEKVSTAMFTLRAGAAPQAVGTYYRLLPGVGREKEAAFFAASPFVRPQADFAQLSGSPLVYWLDDRALGLFAAHSSLGERVRFCRGITTGANARFVRCWWEVGRERVAWGCQSRAEAEAAGRRWLPYMKGGAPRRWFGNAEHVLDWGAELRGYEGAALRNLDFQLRPGATYSSVTGAGLTGRYMPPGFLFDQASNALFPHAPEELELLLALLNHPVADFVLQMNPTVNVVERDLNRIPWPAAGAPPVLRAKVRRAVALAEAIDGEAETSPWFCMPALQTAERAELARLEDEIRGILSGLLGVDLGQAPSRDAPSEEELSWRWLSYAVGIVAGRFRPGVPGELGSAVAADGRHRFAPEVEAALRSLAVWHGAIGLEELAPLVERALGLMGAQAPPGRLAQVLARDYFPEVHLKLYQRRPIYWPLQSREKRQSAVLYAGRLGSWTAEGWSYEPDDGVLLNLAPLHALIPAWGPELRKVWQGLLAGEYDWSRTAKRYAQSVAGTGPR